MKPQVVPMMRKMSYFQGLGLGRNNQGIPEPIDFPHNQFAFGLGYKPRPGEAAQKELIDKCRAKAKREGREYPVACKRFRPTLNGYFVKEGEERPYVMFPEPWYDEATKKICPGIEVFFDVEP